MEKEFARLKTNKSKIKLAQKNTNKNNAEVNEKIKYLKKF